MKHKESLHEMLHSIDKDFGESAIKVKILKVVMEMGIAASIAGIIVNAILQYPIYTIIIHIVGTILLISLLMFIDDKLSLKTASVIVLLYYCFIYTPLSWFYEGAFGSAPFVSFMFGTLIILLLNNNTKKLFMIFYNILLIVIAAAEMLSVHFKGQIDRERQLFVHNIGYFIMYFILMYSLNLFKALYDRQHEELRILSIMDSLTGVFNRGYMNKLLEYFINKYKSDNKIFSLMLCDLNGFKAINDNYGHDVGDRCLIICVNLMKKVMGGRGIIGRIGGDEFIIIVPDKGKEESENLATELSSKLEEFYIPDIGRNIKISIGISDVKEGNNIVTIMKLADKRMYINKRQKTK